MNPNDTNLAPIYAEIFLLIATSAINGSSRNDRAVSTAAFAARFPTEIPKRDPDVAPGAT